MFRIIFITFLFIMWLCVFFVVGLLILCHEMILLPNVYYTQAYATLQTMKEGMAIHKFQYCVLYNKKKRVISVAILCARTYFHKKKEVKKYRNTTKWSFGHGHFCLFNFFEMKFLISVWFDFEAHFICTKKNVSF